MVTLADIRKLVAQEVLKLERRQRGSSRLGTLNSLDNAEGMATGQLELSEDEEVDSVEILNPPGVSFRPGAGAECVVLAISGDPTNLIAIPFVRGQRLTGNDLEAGEIALYIGNADQVVRLKTDGSVLLQSGTSGATLLLKADGNVVVTPSAGGQIYLGADGTPKKVALADDVDARFAALRTSYNTHTHLGVTAGPGVTGIPGAVLAPIATVAATKIHGE
jgi:phage gp45-like